ncbi:DUF6270 domain-containing protein [Glycomyces mayteni]|uniref:DUF6270 domain-containing protein n=1 Tax=Glycomyces mayteni TaxID=543887 RepID=A0ABW2DBJ4_9ACTN|nr:DUF6270 domain-containing protein [Glycomyces mayteni]
MKYSLIGSCVTRDAGDLGAHPLPRPEYYFSRTRIQSIVSDPTPLDPATVKLDSEFQRRVIIQDHDKSVARIAPTLDHPVVIDLIDERAPLVDTGHGLVAATLHFNQAGLGERGDAPVAEDRELADDGPFAEAARRFAALLPDQPVVVHRAMWATEDTSGAPLSNHELAARSNTWLDRAYDLLEAAVGPRATSVTLPPELVVADPGHRWGLAPFHFPDRYYDELADRLRAALAPASARR